MKMLLSVLLIAFLIFSCSSDDDDNEEIDGSYFPLEIGNEWHYKSSLDKSDTTLLIIKVEEKKEINNKSYFSILYYQNINELGKIIKQVYTKDGILYYTKVESGDELLLIFKDTLVTENTYMGLKLNSYINDKNQTIETSAGTFGNLATISIGPVEVDGGQTEVYSKGIGMVQSSWFGGSYELKYCKVSNKEYGKK